MLRRFLLNCDVRAGRFVPLKLPAYIREPILKGSGGVYTREEWSQTRASGYRGAGLNSAELDDSASYLRRMFSTHVCNLHAALRLAETFDFSTRRSVLEFGCGEMIQAYVIKTIYPHLRYQASDFDPYIVEKCRRLPLLDTLEKEVRDVSVLTAGDLAGFDLVLSWELLYALDDVKVSNLFKEVGKAGISLLACTTQLTGPLRSSLRAMKNLNWRPSGFHYERLAKSGELRAHGWSPSVAHYERLAHPSGMKLSRLWTPPASGKEEFSYLLFSPSH